MIEQILRETTSGEGHEFICSGALIAKDSVLTAAHCFGDCGDADVDSDRYKVVIGKALMSEPRDVKTISNVDSITVSEKQVKFSKRFKANVFKRSINQYTGSS